VVYFGHEVIVVVIADVVGLVASAAALFLAIYGIAFNGPATRKLIESTHQDARALIESMHQDTSVLLQAIRADVQAVSHNGQRQHDDLLAYMKDMDRRHSETLSAIATRP
jgi:DNA-binding NarL/FixJ family response regulator